MMCNLVLERIEKWLAGRKKLYLSKGGRFTLLKILCLVDFYGVEVVGRTKN